MPKSKWDEVLSTTASGGATRSNPAQELATAGSGSGGSVSLSGSSIASIELPGGQGSTSDVTEQLSALSTQLSSLASTQQEQTAAIQENTQAVTQNTAEKGGGGASVGSTVGGIASTLVGGGLTLSPIISGLMSLFGGGSATTTAPAPFQLAAPVQYQGGVGSGGGVVPVNVGESGQPRAQSSAAAQQVNIQVNAMDSQSFLDHSNEIADAVRQAILNSHPLNDVIAEL
ncbi:MAG TPA: hypothetical protein VMB25_06195 [Bryobacteraceae bacterium]|nr:hypothetical protein [Bryobacteraceae bacterium]